MSKDIGETVLIPVEEYKKLCECKGMLDAIKVMASRRNSNNNIVNLALLESIQNMIKDDKK